MKPLMISRDIIVESPPGHVRVVGMFCVQQAQRLQKLSLWMNAIDNRRPMHFSKTAEKQYRENGQNLKKKTPLHLRAKQKDKASLYIFTN